MRVEESEFLLAMHWIVGVVDIEHDRRGRPRIAPTEQIDHIQPDARQGAPIGEVL